MRQRSQVDSNGLLRFPQLGCGLPERQVIQLGGATIHSTFAFGIYTACLRPEWNTCILTAHLQSTLRFLRAAIHFITVCRLYALSCFFVMHPPLARCAWFSCVLSTTHKFVFLTDLAVMRAFLLASMALVTLASVLGTQAAPREFAFGHIEHCSGHCVCVFSRFLLSVDLPDGFCIFSLFSHLSLIFPPFFNSFISPFAFEQSSGTGPVTTSVLDVSTS